MQINTIKVDNDGNYTKHNTDSHQDYYTKCHIPVFRSEGPVEPVVRVFGSLRRRIQEQNQRAAQDSRDASAVQRV